MSAMTLQAASPSPGSDGSDSHAALTPVLQSRARACLPSRTECTQQAAARHAHSESVSAASRRWRDDADTLSGICRNWQHGGTLATRRAHAMRGRERSWVTVACAVLAVVVLARHVRAQDVAPMPAGTSTVLKLGNMSNTGAKAVSWTWGFRMLDPRSGRYSPYACTNKPDLQYCGKPCGSEAIGNVECDPNTEGSCESCGGNCPPPGEFPTFSTGWAGINFDLKCMKVVEAVEDEWNPLHVAFNLDISEEEEEGVGIFLVLTNVYGDFDVLGCNTTLSSRSERCSTLSTLCADCQLTHSRLYRHSVTQCHDTIDNSPAVGWSPETETEAGWDIRELTACFNPPPHHHKRHLLYLLFYILSCLQHGLAPAAVPATTQLSCRHLQNQPATGSTSSSHRELPFPHHPEQTLPARLPRIHYIPSKPLNPHS